MPDHTHGKASSLLLDDDTFIATFERGGFGGDEFPHEAHLRMAWLYVTRLGPEAAIDRASAGIRRLAQANSKATLYHDTLTRAWVYLVADAVARSAPAVFAEFLARNPDLADKRLLLQYYSPDVLSSARARATWVAPEKCSIPGAPESSLGGGDAEASSGLVRDAAGADPHPLLKYGRQLL
jgi:hypothetical protein